MKDRELLGQVKYNASDVKEVDTTQIIDLAVVRQEQLKDGEADLTDVEFKNPFDVPDYDPTKKEEDMSIAELDMKELIRGIREFGVLVPLLVRKIDRKNDKGQDQYELLSGYRRKKAVEFINENLPDDKKMKLPIIEVPDCDDDKAIVVLTTSNTHRRKITLAEQIKSCALTYRAMLHRGKSSQDGKTSADIVGEIFHLKPEKVRRYSTLLGLNDGLLTIIGGENDKQKGTRCRNKDGKLKLSARAGELLSKLTEDQQKIVLDFLNDEKNEHVITVALASWIRKKFLSNPKLSLTELEEVVEQWKKSQEAGSTSKSENKNIEISFSNLQSYFPDKTPQEISDKVHFLLGKWREAGSPENFEIKSTEPTQAAVEGCSEV